MFEDVQAQELGGIRQLLKMSHLSTLNQIFLELRSFFARNLF